MPVSSGVQASAPLISEREKNSVAYISPAAAAGLVCGSAGLGPDHGGPGARRRGPHRGTGAEVPIVLIATQAAAASTSNGRRPCRNKDVMFPHCAIWKQAEAGAIVLCL